MPASRRADSSRGPVTIESPPPGGAAAAPTSLQLLADASAQIAGDPHDEQVGDTIVAQVAQALQASDVRLALFDAERQGLVVRKGIGPSKMLLGRPLPASDGVMRELLESSGPLLLDRPPRGLLAAADAPEPASHRAAALVRLKGTTLGYLLIGRDTVLPSYTAADLTPLQILADVAGLRLAYSQLAIRPLHRERELAQLAAAWRPPADLAGDLVVIIDFRGRVV